MRIAGKGWIYKVEKEKQKIINLCSNLFGETKSEIKRNNKSVDELIRIFEELRSDEERAQRLYMDLMNYDDDKVCFEAATCCLKLKRNTKEAEKVLERISRLNPNPLIRFSAEKVLEVWRERGCL